MDKTIYILMDPIATLAGSVSDSRRPIAASVGLLLAVRLVIPTKALVLGSDIWDAVNIMYDAKTIIKMAHLDNANLWMCIMGCTFYNYRKVFCI